MLKRRRRVGARSERVRKRASESFRRRVQIQTPTNKLHLHFYLPFSGELRPSRSSSLTPFHPPTQHGPNPLPSGSASFFLSWKAIVRTFLLPLGEDTRARASRTPFPLPPLSSTFGILSFSLLQHTRLFWLADLCRGCSARLAEHEGTGCLLRTVRSGDGRAAHTPFTS